MKEMLPLNMPAAEAYEAWTKCQSYRPIPWEQLTPIQHEAWRKVAAVVLNWYDNFERGDHE